MLLVMAHQTLGSGLMEVLGWHRLLLVKLSWHTQLFLRLPPLPNRALHQRVRCGLVSAQETTTGSAKTSSTVGGLPTIAADDFECTEHGNLHDRNADACFSIVKVCAAEPCCLNSIQTTGARLCSKRLDNEAMSAPLLLERCEDQVVQLQMPHVLREGHAAVPGGAL